MALSGALPPGDSIAGLPAIVAQEAPSATRTTLLVPKRIRLIIGYRKTRAA